jgi:hypothetical protein
MQMNRRDETMGGRLGLIARAAMAAALLVPALAVAQTPPTPAPPEHLSWYGDPSAPNLSGVWVRVDTPWTSKSKEGWLPWPPPLKGKFAATWKQRVAEQAAGKRTDDPIQGCLPPGMPRFMTGTNGPLLIIQTPGRVMLYRDGDPVRRVWLDGRAQPKPADLEGFSNGNAIGHYEGQDLVTDLVGFKDYPIDSTGIPHSDDLQIQERFHRVDADTLKVVVTLTDKLSYSKPMTTTVTYKTLGNPLWEPKEFICKPKTDYHPDVYVH